MADVKVVEITAKRKEELEKELEWRKNTERDRILTAISEARAQGDLSENADYSSARDAQSKNEAAIAELEETLKKLKRDFKSKIFVPKYITKYLCLGRIVKLKYFGYGIVINCKVGQEIKLINKENSDLIIEYNSNKEKEKEENILSYNEEDLYLKHIGFDEEINSALEGSDNTINNNNSIVLNKRSLRNKEFVSDTISNTHNNNQKLY